MALYLREKLNSGTFRVAHSAIGLLQELTPQFMCTALKIYLFLVSEANGKPYIQGLRRLPDAVGLASNTAAGALELLRKLQMVKIEPSSGTIPSTYTVPENDMHDSSWFEIPICITHSGTYAPMKPSALAVYIALLRYLNRTECRTTILPLSLKDVAERACLSELTTRKALKSLESCSLVVVHRSEIEFLHPATGKTVVAQVWADEEPGSAEKSLPHSSKSISARALRTVRVGNPDERLAAPSIRNQRCGRCMAFRLSKARDSC